MHIRFENVWFAYENVFSNNPPRNQLQDISFEIQPGELVGIAGRSGSGKTTLMQLFNGLLLPQRGRVLVDGQDINAAHFNLVTLRRRLGIVFQFPETQLFAATVEEEIGFGPQQQNLATAEIALRVAEVLQMVGLNESFTRRSPFTLSQGEKRRVALASILAMQPEALVLDEPTASLDARGIDEVKKILQSWHAAKKVLIVISHDVDLIVHLCSRLLILDQGKLLYDGETNSLWSTAKASNLSREILRQAELPLPRSERLRLHLAEKGWA
jgi:energy-coupling factor transport system ATP-binding protein